MASEGLDEKIALAMQLTDEARNRVSRRQCLLVELAGSVGKSMRGGRFIVIRLLRKLSSGGYFLIFVREVLRQ